MKTLFIECNLGAAGDMLSATFMDLMPNPQEFVERLNELVIPIMLWYLPYGATTAWAPGTLAA